MIVDKSFTKEWIQTRRKTYAGADPGLIEKQIYAFELLHCLLKSGKEFVFKGGTSLHLILPDHRRLSTDLDIVGAFSIEELSRLIVHSRFLWVEENVRKKSDVPKRHFKFYYISALDDRESYVLLDTLEQHHTFPKLEERTITSTLFETEEEVVVSTPTLEGMLGDKLTVFAPHTVGIPFAAGKSMEIIKQLFDIGELFGHCKDIKTLIKSYNATQTQESRYRKQRPSREASLDDTIKTSFLVSQYLLKGYQSNAETAEIATGFKQIENHLLGVSFNIDHARVSASKIALLASIIRQQDVNVPFDKLRYDPSQNSKLVSKDLSGSYSILNRLKKLQQLEAFHYWSIVSQMW